MILILPTTHPESSYVVEEKVILSWTVLLVCKLHKFPIKLVIDKQVIFALGIPLSEEACGNGHVIPRRQEFCNTAVVVFCFLHRKSNRHTATIVLILTVSFVIRHVRHRNYKDRFLSSSSEVAPQHEFPITPLQRSR